MASVTLESVYKRYSNGFVAVTDFNLKIQDKEFIIFVGPSGCGKSTTMRMVAGLEEISDGIIKIGNRVVNNLSPKDRDIAMVFQDYALYPHLTVADNMSLSLRLKKEKKEIIKERILNAAKILDIAHLLDRKPKELSGGQRQRVALGRAIVRQAQVYMFDEPLSNLDPKLRTTMRIELKKLHQMLEATMIYVTHDQIEAMTLGDRIVVIDKGVIQQVGKPVEVYNNPDNKFVAGFIGSPPINSFLAAIVEKKDNLFVESAHLSLELLDQKGLYKRLRQGFPGAPEVHVGIRAEDMRISLSNGNLPAIVDVIEPVGSEAFVHLILATEKMSESEFRFVVREENSIAEKLKFGQKVFVNVNREKIHLFDTVEEKTLRGLEV